MTDERDKLPGRSDSARMTAREVPLARPIVGSIGTESAPKALRGQRLEPGLGAPERIRPEEVEFAVLRDVETRDGRALRRAGYGSGDASPPAPPASFERASTLPSPPGTTPRSPETRAVKTGTLLSVGSIDPRAPTERALETPRMFFTRAESEAEVYFEPKAAPRATDHVTVEVETVKIAESADPRRAQTQPRLRVPAPELEPESRAPEAIAFRDLGPAERPGAENPSLDPLEDPDEISTTPEPFARKSDEVRRLHPIATLDPQKVSTRRELPRHKQADLAASLPPARPYVSAPETGRRKRLPAWGFAIGGAALLLMALLWLARRSGRPTVEENVESAPSPAQPTASLEKSAPAATVGAANSAPTADQPAMGERAADAVPAAEPTRAAPSRATQAPLAHPETGPDTDPAPVAAPAKPAAPKLNRTDAEPFRSREKQSIY